MKVTTSCSECRWIAGKKAALEPQRALVQQTNAKLIQCQAAFSAAQLEKRKLTSLQLQTETVCAELFQKDQDRAMAKQTKCDPTDTPAIAGLL